MELKTTRNALQSPDKKSNLSYAASKKTSKIPLCSTKQKMEEKIERKRQQNMRKRRRERQETQETQAAAASVLLHK